MSDHDVFMNLIFLGLVYGVGYSIWFVLRGDSMPAVRDEALQVRDQDRLTPGGRLTRAENREAGQIPK